MNINLYYISSTPNKINKSLGTATTIEGVRFIDNDTLDLVNPSILLKLSDEVSDTAKFNYCKIGKYNRYYFITRITQEHGLTRLDLHVDVLYTFKSDILNSTQYISRSQNLGNRYLVDTLLPMDSRNSYEVKTFGDTVDTNCIHVILETIGKGGAVVE